jgi:hypothetical protein
MDSTPHSLNKKKKKGARGGGEYHMNTVPPVWCSERNDNHYSDHGSNSESSKYLTITDL